MVNRALDLVLIGPPGAGKGTQGRKLAEAFGILHLSIGELLRGEISRSSELGAAARDFLENGDLVPDELVRPMLVRWLHSQAGAVGCVFDGFPRNADQAVLLDGLLAEMGRRVDAALCLQVPDEITLGRMGNLEVCTECGRSQVATPLEPGRCEECGGALRTSGEDAAAARERLRVWRSHEGGVLDLYRRRGILREIDGVGDESDVFGSLRSAIGNVLRR